MLISLSLSLNVFLSFSLFSFISFQIFSIASMHIQCFLRPYDPGSYHLLRHFHSLCVPPPSVKHFFIAHFFINTNETYALRIT